MTPPFSVLLAEDDDPLRACLAEVVAKQGWVVHAASSGLAAIELARRNRPDFSLLDLHLPGLNGLEVLRALQQEVGPVPSIMMSGDATSRETKAALAQGVFCFLRKPLELNTVRETMERLVRHHFGAP